MIGRGVFSSRRALARLGIRVKEADIPVSAVVQGACDMLGMDPLYMANEGKMVIFAAADAAIVGQVSSDPVGMV